MEVVAIWRFHARGAVFLLGMVLASLQTSPLSAQSDSGELPDSGELRVARLVGQLGAADSAARDSATEALQQLGSATRPQLEQALASPDPEVRLRARTLLDDWKTDELWSASLVDLAGEGELASAALATISAQSSNRLLVGDTYGTFRDKPFQSPQQHAAFWEVVDTLCRETGNHLRPHYDVRSGGFVICGGAPGHYPTAYSGPLRAQLTGARRVFVEELDYAEPASEVTHSFQFNLQMMWEERFSLLGYTTQPELIEARTDSGKLLTALQPSAGSWNALTPGARHLTATLRLTPPPADATRLDVLKLRWQLLAVGDRATLVAPEVAAGRTYSQEDVELSVESLDRQPSGRYELVVIIARDRPLPEPAEILFQENEIELFDVAGRAMRLQNHSHQIIDRGLQVKLLFAGEADSTGPRLLRLRYPRLRARRGMELVFRDVPLPVSQPR